MKKNLLLGLGLLVLCGLVGLVAWHGTAGKKSDLSAGERPTSSTLTQTPSGDASSESPASSTNGSSHPTTPAAMSATTAIRPVSMVGNQRVFYPGQFAKAEVTAGGKSYALTPNQLGNFQRINVGPKEKVQVQVAYPQGAEGDPVAVVVEDGGHLNENQMSEVAALDKQQNVRFQFQTTGQSGIYRIVLNNGADVKVLNFWVGQEPQFQK